ncbi:MAG: FHA domain-containing protein [bacterium]|nr:FHA domain-containing protein [bacterium]
MPELLQLRFSVDGEDKIVALAGPEIRFGRSGDNEVVLPDYSVSRRHAAVRSEEDGWYVYDLDSTNGVQVNGANVERSRIRPGDRLKVGVFEILVEGQMIPIDQFAPIAVDEPLQAGVREEMASLAGPAPRQPEAPVPLDVPPPLAAGPPRAVGRDSAISNATIIRSLSDFSADYGLDGMLGGGDSSAIRKSKREALDEAYASQVFGFLTRLARLLITTESDDEILKHVLEIAFEALPVDRGFILLRDQESGQLECELARLNDQVMLRPESVVPISKTMLESVIQERVALLTYDALSDQRLAGTESVRIHQIRAAMCAPLWSGEKIIGVMQVDSPHHTGSFTEPDVDLLVMLANYCAVAIERNRHAREAELERQFRSRLERYHSPAVIEEVMQQGAVPGDEAIRRLKPAEVTVLFADIVGFTAYSEKAEPEDVAALLEGYFSHAIEAIFAAGGTLDKFIGDCVMAFFGAPMSQPDHAERAVRAAVSFCEALDDWNAERERQGLPTIGSRIGINSGPVVVGDIGSNRRVDYTVLGNTVNLAARLEEKVASPGDIVIGEATRRMLGDQVPTESLGELRLKGLSQAIVAYRLVRGR